MKQPLSKPVLRNAIISIVGLISLIALAAHSSFTSSSSIASVDPVTAQIDKARKKLAPPQATPMRTAGKPNVPSAVTITATMTDNVTPNTTKVLPGSTINYTVVINSTGTTDATAVAFNDVIDANTTLVNGSVHASPVAANETYNWVGNTFLDSSARSLPSVLANDTISSSPDTIVLTTLTNAATMLGGTVTLPANGNFTYTPPLGRPNAVDGASVNDSFNYTVTNSADPTLTATGTATINLSGRVWYLQAGAAGDGRSGTPSGSPSAMSTAADKSADIFYVFSNAGSLNGLFTLDSGQTLLGQGVNLIVNTITLFSAGAAPTTTGSAGNGVTLGIGNTLSGFNIGNCSGTAISGTNVGTLNVSSVSINTTGAGLDLTGVSTPTVSVVLGGLTSTGGAKNVNLVGLSGTVTLGGGALSGASGNAFDVTNPGNAVVTYSGTIGNTTARSVNVSARNGGSVTLSGAVSGSALGINLTSNGGSTISFTGGISLSTGANPAFTATGGGTVTATQNNTTIVNTLTTTTGTALTVSGTTIGASGLTFRSISSSGAANGILLNNTGSTAGLTVSGNGGTCTSAATCTGGAIQTTTGDGISLGSTRSTSLTNMIIKDTGGSGILGTTVTSLTIAGFRVEGAGDAAGEHGIFITNLFGTSSVTGSTFIDSAESQLKVRNTSATVNAPAAPQDILTVANSSFSLSGGAFVGDHIQYATETTANARFIVNNTGGGVNISGAVGIAGVQCNASSGSRLDVQISGVTRTGGTGTGINMNPVGPNTFLSYHINNNNISNTNTIPINATVIAGGATTANPARTEGTIDNNTVSNSPNASGIVVIAEGNAQVNSVIGTVAITNNNISGIGNGSGISVQARVGGTLNLTITGNTSNINNALNLEGISVTNGSSAAGDTVNNICLNMANNKSTVGALSGQEDYRLTARNPITASNNFQLQNFVGSGTSATDVTTWVTTTKNNKKADGVSTPTVQVSFLTSGAFSTSAGCPTTTFGPEALGNNSLKSEDLMPPPNPASTNVPASDTETINQSRTSQQTASAWQTSRANLLQTMATPSSHDFKFASFEPGSTLSERARPASYSVATAAQKTSPNAPQTTVTQNIPVLPAGKSVTIKFAVTVNNPPAAAQVSTQGTVSATGISNVLTDDPDTATAGDPTVTLIDLTITWAGGTSTNWDTGSNWNTTFTPIAINDVSIPAAGVTNEPTISASSPSVNSVTIATGRTLTITGQTLNVAGNWTNSGALAGNGTVVFNGNNNTQTLAGSTMFNNLTINHTGTGNVTASGSTLAVSNLLRIQAGTFISSSTFKDVQIDSGASLQSDGGTMNVSGNWTNNGGTFTPGAGTVIFNSTTAGQTIAGTATSQTFNIVQVNKSGQTLVVGGSTTTLNLNGALTLTAGTFDAGTAATINAAGNWTNNGGTFTPGSSTVVFNSTTAGQTIGGTAATQTFGSLTVNKTGQTLSVGGSTTTLNINGTLLLTAGTFDKGTAATINVAGNWTKNGGIFTQGTGTVVFGGASAQTIGGATATTFNNLTINNSTGVTLGAAVTVNGTLTLTLGVLTNGANLTLGNGATISRSGGSLSAAPTFGATVNIVYTGSSPITTGPEIPSSTTVLSNLTINDSGGVTLSANATVNVLLTLTTGDLKTGPTGTEFTLTMPAAATSGPATNATDVVGNVKRTGFVSAGAALSFGNPFNTIQINSGTAPTDITVNLDKAVPTTPAPFASAIARKYTITPTAGAGISATLRLHYLDSELNGNTEGLTLNLFRYDGANWHKEGQTANDTTNNWVEKTMITQFSPWTMNSSVPTEAKLESFNATGYEGGTFIEWRTGFETDNLGFNLYRDEGGKRVAVNSQLVAGSALVAGSGVALRAGQSYGWWDGAASKSSAQYWLESVDLNGQSSWHGPFSSRFIGGGGPARRNSSMLGRIENAQAGLTLPVEQAASPQSLKPKQIALQSGLAGQPAVKMWVKREGFYRVSASELAAAGLAPRTETRLLQLYADGQQIPINVISDKDGLLAAIEFYGRGLDAAFTDQRVYWLISGSEPGLRIQQLKGGGQPIASRSFLYTAEHRDRTIYFSALRNGERENFFGAVIAASPVDQSLTIQHVDQSPIGTATLEVALQGVTTLPHRVWVYLNGTFAGEVALDGQAGAVSTFNVAQSLLRSGDNQVRLVAQAGTSDITLVDHIGLTYWHSFTADDNALRLTSLGNQEVTIDGFSSSAIRVLDVTDPDAPQELEAKIKQQESGFAVTVASTGSGERQLLAITDDRSSQPEKLAANLQSSLRSPSHAADLVIIARREFFSAIEPLRSLRSKQGLKIELADVDDVFDEFSFGTKSPQAVKDFLLYATTSWKLKPRFVLLVGDASYDGKNYLRLGDSDLVPTRLIDTALMETASDDSLADFNSDGIADLAVGRLAARTPAEASAMVRKIIGYEASQPLESMLLVADINNGFDFESASTQLGALIPGNLRVEQINRGQLGDAAAKTRLIEAITQGQKVVNYMGHGSVNLWSGSLLTNEDAANLTNAERLPLFVMMTCLNGYFHDPALDSLAESLLKSENGGAVAVWTSTGMTGPDEQLVLNKQLYQLLFTGGNVTLGEATARAKAATTDLDIRRTWVLLGDPTMRLK